MGAPLRTHRAGLEEDFLTQPYQYSFHQAVVLSELLRPDATPVGEGSNPTHEALSLKSRILYAYPPSDLYEITPEKFGDRLEIHVNFLGIAGSNGPLPLPYTEKLFDRVRHQDTAGRDFLDIFNHRLLSIFHRIRKKHWVGLSHDPPHKTPLAHILRSLLGLGTPHTHGRLHLQDRALLNHASLLWQRPRSAIGLETLLAQHFGIPVRLSPCIGGWTELESEQTTLLGTRFSVLGQGASLGTRVWEQHKTATLHLGPLTQETFESFLEGGTRAAELFDLIQFYKNPDQAFAINLIMRGKDIEPARLGAQTRLGWTSWLRARKTMDDAQVTLHGF